MCKAGCEFFVSSSRSQLTRSFSRRYDLLFNPVLSKPTLTGVILGDDAPRAVFASVNKLLAMNFNQHIF